MVWSSAANVAESGAKVAALINHCTLMTCLIALVNKAMEISFGEWSD